MGTIFKKAIFVKMFCSKVMANLEQLRRPSAVFSHKISFYASFEAYSYVFTAQTMGLWKTACDSLAQTRERHGYTDHEYYLPHLLAYMRNINRRIIHN